MLKLPRSTGAMSGRVVAIGSELGNVRDTYLGIGDRRRARVSDGSTRHTTRESL